MTPAADTTGLLAAVISAALFTFTLVFAARRRGQWELETTLRDPAPPAEPELFSLVLIERRPPELGLTASVAMHALAVLGWCLVHFLVPGEPRFDFRRYTARIIELRIPEPLLFTPRRGALDEDSAKLRGSRSAGRAAKIRRSEDGPEAASRRPRFELPASKTGDRDVVIQPDLPTELLVALVEDLPRALLWAQGPAPLDEWSRVGAESARQTPARFDLPQATPRAQTPNRELTVSDLQIGAQPQPFTFRPRLEIQTANAPPVSLLAAENPTGQMAATPLPPGSPVNLMILTQTPAVAAPGYLLQPGNRLSRQEPAGSPGTGGPSGAARAESSGNAPEGAGKASHAELLAGASAASVPREANPDTRYADPGIQPASRGSLGVIVVQQSAQGTLLEGSEVLSGEPIYTVFLDVPGYARRWILQYCIPGSMAPPLLMAVGEGVIRVMPRKSVQPPFPLERIPVPAAGYQGAARRLVVYALVTERGEMTDVRLIRGAGQPVDEAAVATLMNWLFSPARQGEAPVAVEALFGIPLDP